MEGKIPEQALTVMDQMREENKRLRQALKDISSFQDPGELRKEELGLGHEEVLEMAYENMKQIAIQALSYPK